MASSKSIILDGFKESFSAIWKNKLLFLLLFILQLVFFALISYVNLNYQTKILESAKAITDYLNKQQLDEASLAKNVLEQKSILGDDPLSVSRNFNEMLKNFREYLIYLFLLLLLFISIMWALTHGLIHKINFKKTLKNLLKIFVVLLFYLSLIFLFFFSLFNISIADITMESSTFFVKYLVFLIFSVILAFFMFVSLALAGKTELGKIVQKTLSVGIKKIHYVLLVYFINIALLIIPVILIYDFIEKNQIVLFASIALFILVIIFSRIFMVNVIEKLEI
ncbi:hypothetical protein HYX02_04255 [Candidatus Woesearchaeota archaeon]|nr:hypothetical protein [Candidatus Woesearchaeota archaeon]